MDDLEMNVGEQPLDAWLTEIQLSNQDLAQASTEQLTHKQVQKARKGRRVTLNIQMKIIRAIQKATEGKSKPALEELFNYRGKS